MSAYAAFSSRNFRFLLAGLTFSNLGAQMLGVVVGWDLYLIAKSPVVLGNVGLVQIIPVFLFTFVAGHVADRYDRTRTVLITQSSLAIVGLALAFAGSGRGVFAIYSALFLSATARAFQWPVTSAIMPQTVPPETLTNAISWNGSARELATVGGPGLAGVLLAAMGSEAVYLAQATFSLLATACFFMLKIPPVKRAEHEAEGWKAVAEGLKFVWRDKLILSALTLDLFAVIFGGETTLLPIFAEDILKVGPTGLGWLRAASAGGAVLMSIWLAHHSTIRHAGVILLLAVAGFGAAMIGFGLSTVAWLSFIMLFMSGVFDAVSVVLRISLVQSRTPDALRGRVSAVNGLFIASSNQWGAVESGLVAAWLGTAQSVVWNGTATIAVVLVIWVVSRSLRNWSH